MASQKELEDLQKKILSGMEEFKSLQENFDKVRTVRQQLEAQLLENESVYSELSLVGSDAKVLKLVGPVLITQSLTESKQNVQKRIDYINGELKRQEATLKDISRNQDSKRESIQKLQQVFQQKARVQPGPM